MLPDDVKLGMTVQVADLQTIRDRWDIVSRDHHVGFNTTDMAFMCGRLAVVTDIEGHGPLKLITLKDRETGEILNELQRRINGSVWFVTSYMLDHHENAPRINIVRDHSLTLLEQLENAREQQYLEIIRGH